MAPTRQTPRTAAPDPIRPGVHGPAEALLRQRISEGHYPAGTRLAEEPVAAELGISRTPVRLAFRALAQEGLLEVAGKRGYVVRAFTAADVLCAVEVRGALEGLAARRLAERGLTAEVRGVLQGCVDEGEATLARGRLAPGDVERWQALNARFHAAIVGADTSRVIADTLARNDLLPFASAGSITVQANALAREYRKLHHAQVQHQLVFEALVQREAARVEALMREHALIGVRYATHFGLEPVVDVGPQAR